MCCSSSSSSSSSICGPNKIWNHKNLSYWMLNKTKMCQPDADDNVFKLNHFERIYLLALFWLIAKKYIFKMEKNYLFVIRSNNVSLYFQIPNHCHFGICTWVSWLSSSPSPSSSSSSSTSHIFPLGHNLIVRI